MFLTFIISLTKGFNITDSDLPELKINVLNIKNEWFCIKSIFELALRKPKEVTCVVRLNRKILFWKKKVKSFQKGQKGEVDF